MAQGIDVRQTSGRLQFRVLLLDNTGAVVTAGTTNLRLYELQDGGTLESYDFNDNTFKTTALTTENLAMTHRTGNNSTTNTGIWTVDLTTLTGFVAGNIYFIWVTNSNASPPVQVREFQFGNEQGDQTVTSTRLNVNVEAINTSTNAADRLDSALTATGGIDVNLEQALDTTPTADTTGDSLFNAARSLPNGIVPAASGGLPTVDANNRIAGIQGSRYNTLDDIGTLRLVNTTATGSSTSTQIVLSAVPGTDVNDDYNGKVLIIYDISNSNRPSVHTISDWTASTNTADITPACLFTPANGDFVEIWAGADSTILTELLKLTSGFGAASPETLNAYLKAIMSKGASTPSGLGTFNPATDSIESLREQLDLIEGAGFSTATDSLAALRDAFDTLIAPSVVTSTSLSGSGMISDCIGLVRRLADEPSTQPKYANADVLEIIHAAFDVILADININGDSPVLVRYDIPLVSGTLVYTLPPNVAQVWRVAKVNATTHIPEWEIWPGNEFSFSGRGFTLEGNTIRLLTDWHDSTTTLQLLYMPTGEVTMHKGETDTVTANTLTLADTPIDGEIDTRKNAYGGYLLRILSNDGPNRVEEIPIASYDNTTGIITLVANFDETPTGDVIYEVVPQFSRLLKHVVCMRAALDILAIEGNAKKITTLTSSFQAKMSALRRFLSSKNARFPGSLEGDTNDNLNRGYWGWENF